MAVELDLDQIHSQLLITHLRQHKLILETYRKSKDFPNFCVIYCKIYGDWFSGFLLSIDLTFSMIKVIKASTFTTKNFPLADPKCFDRVLGYIKKHRGKVMKHGKMNCKKDLIIEGYHDIKTRRITTF